MCEIEQTVQKTLLGIPSSIGIFNTLVVRKDLTVMEQQMFKITNVNKGYLVQPQMLDQPGNMVEHIAQLVQRRAASLVWRAALEKPSVNV